MVRCKRDLLDEDFFSEKKNHANGKIIVPVCKVATCDAPAADYRMQKGNTRIVNHNDFAYGGCHIVSFYEKESAHQAFVPQRQAVSWLPVTSLRMSSKLF